MNLSPLDKSLEPRKEWFPNIGSCKEGEILPLLCAEGSGETFEGKGFVLIEEGFTDPSKVSIESGIEDCEWEDEDRDQEIEELEEGVNGRDDGEGEGDFELNLESEEIELGEDWGEGEDVERPMEKSLMPYSAGSMSFCMST